MQVIELCGKPGVGKSTLINEVKKRLEKNNNVLYREDILEKNFFQRLMCKLEFYFLYYCFPISVIRKIKQGIFSIEKVNLKYVYRLYSLKKGLNRYKNKDVIILLEEGPLQYISSVAHLERIEEHTELKKLIRLFQDIDVAFIVCECRDEECAKRIHARRKKGDRFFDENMDVILSKVIIKENNIKYLLNSFNKKSIQISMENEIEGNVSKIIEMIEMYEYEKNKSMLYR